MRVRATVAAFRKKPAPPSWLTTIANLLRAPLANLFTLIRSVGQAIASTWRPSFPPLTRMLGVQEPWEVARNRHNQQIFVRLRTQGKVFGVATYHMPCVFWDPRVIAVHAALSAQHVQRLAGTDPYIFAGDFNLKPGSGPYRLLTQGSLPPSDPDLPPPRDGDPWTPALQEPLESAYVKAQGREPDFTNYAQILSEAPFIDCIDYIFCKPGINVVSCDPLPSRAQAKGPMPTEAEPSDHILLGATFNLG